MLASSRDAAAATAENPVVAEYHALSQRLRELDSGAAGAPQLVGLSSCQAGAGVSTTAVNLALAVAEKEGDPVLLIDAQFERPSLQRVFQTPIAPGLAEQLHGEDERSGIYGTSVRQVFLMPAGGQDWRQRPRWDALRASSMLHDLRGRYALVLVDLPPVSSLHPILKLAELLDGVLLVLESERSNLETALDSKRRLKEMNAQPLGVVFNKSRGRLPAWVEKRS